ncbi:MAG: V-type ATPase subunit subunit G family protein [Deltaproteobacteria bacterium]|jgi:V/A-type H+/Na+-transporting ATPase subunit G/H
MIQGLELIKNLAELDRELTDRVEAARRSAELRIKRAEEESRRLVAEAEAQIRRLEEDSRARLTEDRARLAEEARTRAAGEKECLHSQAEPNFDRAVEFVLSEVIP